MGIYARHVLPRIVNVACGMKVVEPLRQRVCEGLHGKVVELGFGRRWQHRLEPMQKRVFGDCHLTRPVVDMLKDAGFTIAELDVFYETGAPKPFGADSLGIAVAP